MKKQIFILVFVLFALGMTNSYGQLTPRKVTCLTPDALHPIPGNPFTYQIEIPGTPTGGTPWLAGTLKYTWYVTQNPNFITFNTATGLPEPTPEADRQKGDGTGILLKTADVAKYNIAGNTSNSISLTWKSFYYDPNVPIFVVISVAGYNGLCSPSNLKVFKIEPQNVFTVDIDNLTEIGSQHTAPIWLAGNLTFGNYGDNYSQCISPIQSSKYLAAQGVVYDFGKNILMYEVVASNWYTSWRPSFTLKGVDPLETITVQYTTDTNFATAIWETMTPSAAHSTTTSTVLTYTTTSSVFASTAVLTGSGFVDDPGESIYVRVTLLHSDGTSASYQGLTDENIYLAVDGLTNLAVAGKEIGDVHTVAGLTLPSQACPWVDGFVNDIAHQTIKGRPTINTPVAIPTLVLLPVKP